MEPRDIPVLVATTTAALPMSDGSSVVIHTGERWYAKDQVVKEHPGVFSDDPRYDLKFTGAPPKFMQTAPGVPVEDEGPAEEPAGQRGGRRRSRSEEGNEG